MTNETGNTGEAPRWALNKACQAIGRKLHHYDQMQPENPLRASITAHAALIAKFDAPPADRRYQCAEQALYEVEIGAPAVTPDPVQVGVRAIDLWVVGHGR